MIDIKDLKAGDWVFCDVDSYRNFKDGNLYYVSHVTPDIVTLFDEDSEEELVDVWDEEGLYGFDIGPPSPPIHINQFRDLESRVERLERLIE